MAVVYLARQVKLNRLVALKTPLLTRPPADGRPPSGAAQDEAVWHIRFLAEAEALAAIRHPNVVGVYEFGHPPGHGPFFAMEYLDDCRDPRAIRDMLPKVADAVVAHIWHAKIAAPDSVMVTSIHKYPTAGK
jgi:serine/threonine-protein kinase